MVVDKGLKCVSWQLSEYSQFLRLVSEWLRLRPPQEKSLTYLSPRWCTQPQEWDLFSVIVQYALCNMYYACSISPAFLESCKNSVATVTADKEEI